MQQAENYDYTYWAAKKPEDVAAIALAKGDTFYNRLRKNAYLEKVEQMWKAYHGIYGDDMSYGHEITFTGEQGELVKMPVNHFRNLARHIYVMVTANRPIMEARAVNGDYKSLAQTYLANGILDYYMREKGLENSLKRAVEMAIVLGSSFIKLDWNATAGDTYDVDPETEMPVKEGEIEFSVLSPFDVVFDGTKENWEHDWILVRSFQNKYNLMAKYPELAERLRQIGTKNDASSHRLSMWTNDDTDDIPVYELFHRKSEALPEGRYVLFADAQTVMLDTKLPYKVVPIYRIAPSDILGTPYGYTDMFDIYPIQEGINALFSTIMTNNNAFGVQNLWIKKGSDINISSLAGGLNVIESDEPPQPINLTQTAAETFKAYEMLVETGQVLSGVNSVARGDPQASLKSGTSLALVQSMALQYVSGIQQSYIKLVEDVGTAIIQILKDFATTPKVVALVGQNNRPLLKEFTGDQISEINRVIVDVGNPLSRTMAGRVQIAQELLQMNAIKNPNQYLQILNTGRLDQMYDGEVKELLLIRKENEMMLNGEEPLVAPLDLHSQHILEHRDILSDPELRTDPNFLRRVNDHIAEHLHMLETTDPRLLQLIHEQPIPPLQAAIQPGPNGAPQGGVAPPQGAQAPDGQTLQADQGPIKGGSLEQPTNLPSMPKPPAPFESLPVTADQMTTG